MILHQKDRGRQAKGVDGRHQEPLLHLSRRRFMAGAGALVIGLTLRGGAATADSTAGGLRSVAGGDATPSLWIAIEQDGTVRLTCHRSDMGQQVWTSMAQLVADELEADWDRVTIAQAEGHQRYGDQNTDGSRSVRYNDYPVARLTEAPYETHVHLLPSHGLPAGVGEPGVPPTIPAFARARGCSVPGVEPHESHADRHGFSGARVRVVGTP